MKRLSIFIIIFMLLWCGFAASAQLRAPARVKWSMEVEMLCDTLGEVIVKAVPSQGWHLYGIELPDGGPVPTTIDFDGSRGVLFTDSLTYDITPVTVHDTMFDLDITWWDKPVTFRRQFKISEPSEASISAKITSMACNDETCTPPAVTNLSVQL